MLLFLLLPSCWLSVFHVAGSIVLDLPGYENVRKPAAGWGRWFQGPLEDTVALEVLEAIGEWGWLLCFHCNMEMVRTEPLSTDSGAGFARQGQHWAAQLSWGQS